LGTLREIFTQAVRFIPEADLLPHLYTDWSSSLAASFVRLRPALGW